MTDNNKFIPKLPETKTEIVLNQEQNQPQTEQSTVKKLTETAKETVIPTVHASDEPSREQRDKEEREGIERVIGGGIATTGACNPLLGGIAIASSEIVGGVAKGIGQITGDQGTKEVGETFTKAPVRPLKDAKEALEEK